MKNSMPKGSRPGELGGNNSARRLATATQPESAPSPTLQKPLTPIYPPGYKPPRRPFPVVKEKYPRYPDFGNYPTGPRNA